MCDGHEFFFEFDRAFNHQLVEKFEASPEHPLAPDVVPSQTGVQTGVYALYRKGQLVYAGKALNTTLARRLSEHYRKIARRRNIDVSDVFCRFLLIESDWFVRAAEDALIQHYTPLWQSSGFGSHVPGRGRPGIRTSRWDQEYPPRD